LPAPPSGRLCAAILLLAGLLLLPTLSLGHHSEGFYFDLLARGLSWPEFLRASWPSHADVFIRPVAFLSWKLNASLGAGRAWTYHLVNIGLHLAVVALLLGLARDWSGQRRYAGGVALLYALFPAHATTVGWVVARFDLLAILAAVASLWLLQRILQDRGHPGHALGVALLLALGLLCKESIAALPLALSAWPFLQLAAPLAPARKLAFRAIAGAWGVLLGYLLLRLAILDQPWGYAQFDWVGTGSPLEMLRSFGPQLAANLVLPCSALRLGKLGVGCAAALVLVVTVAAIRERAARAALGAGLVLLASALAPVGSIVHWAVTENDWYYLSFPAIGVAWLLAAPLLARDAARRRLGYALVALLATLYAIELEIQVGHWSSARRQVAEILRQLKGHTGNRAAVYVFGPAIRFPGVVGVNLTTAKLSDTPLAAAATFRPGPGLMNLERLSWLHQLPPYRCFSETGYPGIDAIPDPLTPEDLTLARGDSVWRWDPDHRVLRDLSDLLHREARPIF
jgi:hypothetical protein